MANIIQIKKTSVTGNTPDANNLLYGELAINYADGKLFYKDDANVIQAIYLQNLYETMNVNGTLLIPTSTTDILNFQSGNGITISANSTTETIIIDETLSPIINAVFDFANTRYSSNGGTIYGSTTITGSLVVDTTIDTATITTQNSYSDKFSANSVIANTSLIAGGIVSNTSLYAQSLHSNTTLIVGSDATIYGNLIVLGNTLSVNTQTLSIDDSLISLARNNQTDIVDIGFYGHYANTPNLHTGLVRHAADQIYYLFDNLQTEPGGTIDVANVRIATVNANVISTSITLRGLDPLDHANGAFDKANAAYILANTASDTANLKFDKAGGTVTGDTTFAQNVTVNGTIQQINSSIYSGNASMATVSQTTIDTFSVSLAHNAKYQIVVIDNDIVSSYHSTEMMLVWNNNDIYKTEYATVTTNGDLGTFDANVVSGSVYVYFTPNTSTSKTVKYLRFTIG